MLQASSVPQFQRSWCHSVSSSMAVVRRHHWNFGMLRLGRFKLMKLRCVVCQLYHSQERRNDPLLNHENHDIPTNDNEASCSCHLGGCMLKQTLLSAAAIEQRQLSSASPCHLGYQLGSYLTPSPAPAVQRRPLNRREGLREVPEQPEMDEGKPKRAGLVICFYFSRSQSQPSSSASPSAC